VTPPCWITGLASLAREEMPKSPDTLYPGRWASKSLDTRIREDGASKAGKVDIIGVTAHRPNETALKMDEIKTALPYPTESQIKRGKPVKALSWA
jgi:hypothetical protein